MLYLVVFVESFSEGAFIHFVACCIGTEESRLLRSQGTITICFRNQFPSKQVVFNKELTTEGIHLVVPVARKSQ
jgi:hypothetical protein